MSTEDGNGRASNVTDPPITAISGRERSNANLRPFPPGVSGNPSGRPKQSKVFRERNRQLAMKLQDRLFARLDGLDDSKESISELARALETFAEHGGFLTADKLATVEAAFARMLLAIAAAENLTTDQKQLAIAQANQLHAEAVGDEDE